MHWRTKRVVDSVLIKPFQFIGYVLVSFFIGAALATLLLLAMAWADELPGGMTCTEVRVFAAAEGYNAEVVWDRERARAIAESYGLLLTDRQLDALEKCFPPLKKKAR